MILTCFEQLWKCSISYTNNEVISTELVIDI